MSLDHLKKQAKNAQVLLKEFGVPGEVQLHDGQRFVARLRGFPNWQAACDAERVRQPETAGTASRGSVKDEFWMVDIREFATDSAASSDAPFQSDIRIIRGAMDALAMVWMVWQHFDGHQEYPGSPNDFTVKLTDCEHPGALAGQSLLLSYAGPRRRLRVEAWPLEESVMMLKGPYSEPDPELLAALATRKGPDDMRAVLRAAEVVYREAKAEIESYHADHPVKSVFAEIEKYLKEHASAPSGPRGGFWIAHEARLGKWRFRLIFQPANDSFSFDAFNETGAGGSFTEPTAVTVLRRQASGKWVIDATDTTGAKVPLSGLGREVTEALEKLATDYGVGLDVEGVTRCRPPQAGLAPAQATFIEGMRKKHPEVLAGGPLA